MKSKIITFTLLSLFLSGCVSGFKQPEDGPMAKLTIKTLNDDVGNLWVYRYIGDVDTYNCSSEPSEAVAILNNMSVIGSYADKGEKLKEITINVRANEKIRLGVLYANYAPSGGSLNLGMCLPHLELIPKEAGRYEFVHSWDGKICDSRYFSDNDSNPQHEFLPICFDSKNMAPLWESKIRKARIEIVE